MESLEVSGAVRPLYGSLGFKGLMFLASVFVSVTKYLFIFSSSRFFKEINLFFLLPCDCVPAGDGV